MPSWKQAAEYQESGAVKAAEVAAAEKDKVVVDEETGEKKFHFTIKTVAIVAAVVVFVVVIGIFISAGINRNKDKMENPGVEDPFVQPTTGTIDDDFWGDDPVFSYSEEELSQLRAWGYTASEIEEFQSNEESASAKIAQAKQERQAALDSLNNPNSPEYQALINQTWIGEPDMTLPAADTDYLSEVTWAVKTENLDYDKVPARGTNLFLKVYLENDRVHFMQVPFERYISLPDSGNIVVSYQEVLWNNTVVVQDMTEVEVTG